VTVALTNAKDAPSAQRLLVVDTGHASTLVRATTWDTQVRSTNADDTARVNCSGFEMRERY